MSCQDWTPVIFPNKSKKTSEKVVIRSKNTVKSQQYKEDEDGKQIKKALPKDFGNKIQVARAAKGWSQKELAQKLSVKVSEIQEYEQNRIENPNRRFARKIERVLGAELF